MTVHVDEIHSQVSAGAPGHPPPDGPAAPDGTATRADLREDRWRGTEARVEQLRCRVAAEGFDD